LAHGFRNFLRKMCKPCLVGTRNDVDLTLTSTRPEAEKQENFAHLANDARSLALPSARDAAISSGTLSAATSSVWLFVNLSRFVNGCQISKGPLYNQLTRCLIAVAASYPKFILKFILGFSQQSAESPLDLHWYRECCASAIFTRGGLGLESLGRFSYLKVEQRNRCVA